MFHQEGPQRAAAPTTLPERAPPLPERNMSQASTAGRTTATTATTAASTTPAATPSPKTAKEARVKHAVRSVLACYPESRTTVIRTSTTTNTVTTRRYGEEADVLPLCVIPPRYGSARCRHVYREVQGVSFFFFPTPSLIFAFFSQTPSVFVTQIRGHVAGPLPPPLRHLALGASNVCPGDENPTYSVSVLSEYEGRIAMVVWTTQSCMIRPLHPLCTPTAFFYFCRHGTLNEQFV